MKRSKVLNYSRKLVELRNMSKMYSNFGFIHIKLWAASVHKSKKIIIVRK